MPSLESSQRMRSVPQEVPKCRMPPRARGLGPRPSSRERAPGHMKISMAPSIGRRAWRRLARSPALRCSSRREYRRPLADAVTHQSADIVQCLVGDAVQHRRGLASARDQSGGGQAGEMLRCVLAADPRSLSEVSHRNLASRVQNAEEAKARRVA